MLTKKDMKKIFSFVIVISFLSCGDTGNTNNGSADSIELENPAEIQPPADAIPDSMSIINDSVILPDPSGRSTTTEGTRHDSL